MIGEVRLRGVVLALACTIAVLAGACASSALAASSPRWYILTRSAPTHMVPGQRGEMVTQIVNLGSSPVVATSTNPVTITDVLPAGVTQTGALEASGGLGTDDEANPLKLSCPTTPVPHCVFIGELPPYDPITLQEPVEEQSAPSTQNIVEVEGGNTPPATTEATTPKDDLGGFGVERYELRPETENGEIDKQAGSHPFQLTTVVAFNQGFGVNAAAGDTNAAPTSPELLKNLNTVLPAGLAGNTNAVPQCPASFFSSVPRGNFNGCPADTAIGTVVITAKDSAALGFGYFTETIPLFNLETAPGEPARLGFEFETVPVTLDTSVKTGEGYAVQVSSTNTSTSAEVMSAIVTVWGVPDSGAHALARGWECIGGGEFRQRQDPNAKDPQQCEEAASKVAEAPYLTLPARCDVPTVGEPTEAETRALTSTVEANAWGHPTYMQGPSSVLTLEGCDSLPFGESQSPRIAVSPFTHDASTPTGLKDTIEVPQNTLTEPVLDESEEPGKAEADISKTTLRLPPGVLSNAGLVNYNASDVGELETCSVTTAGFGGGLFPGSAAALEATLGEQEASKALTFEESLEGELNALAGSAALNDTNESPFADKLAAELSSQQFTAEPSQSKASRCGELAKIGDVKIVSPLLKEPLEGSLYLGRQGTNPFKSDLVVYLMAYNPTSGVRVKLAGEVKIGGEGQLISTFAGTPPVPFEKLEVTLPNEENGERAANSTPAQCGEYKSEATFTTFSDESKEGAASAPLTVASKGSEFDITAGVGGSACPPTPLAFTPTYEAGPTVKQAGALTPFTAIIGHADGQQSLKSIELQLPPGEAALISQVTPCPEADAVANPNKCGPESLIGHTTSISGLGGKPVTLGGQLYLTGALQANAKHGASPFGLLAVTEAVAGPFNLGDVDVLSTINVNEKTTAATVTSEPIPQFVEGVPAQLKQIIVTVERPGNQPFEFNPTNCEELELKGHLGGWEGASPPFSEPFYVTGCGSLPFAPKLTATVKAQGSKFNGTSFKVTVESPGLGQANIHKVDLTLPAVLPSRESTIEKACLAATFEANPASCDEGSVIGEGVVTTPVFKNPLRGPAYLVSHGAAEFPDVEFVLQGEGVKILLDGKTDIKKGITYSKFETSPDAPFTKFESIFPEGPHSALTTYVPEAENYNLCKHASQLVIPTVIVGQNGAAIEQSTHVSLEGCGGVEAFHKAKLSRAQKLAKALKACKKDKKKGKRVACERAARKKYGSKAKKSSKRGKQSAKK
jgi:hypothetical protein